MTEAAINGVCHLFQKTDWYQLLANRVRDPEKIMTLSADFIIQHANDLNLKLLTMVSARMCDYEELRKGYTLEFFHKFWRFVEYDAGAAAQMAWQLGGEFNTHTFENLLVPTLYDKKVLSILVDTFDKPDTHKRWKDLPSCADYEKNPFHYDAVQLKGICGLNKDIPLDWIERFVHLINFHVFFENMRLSDKDKEAIIEKFGVQIAGSSRYLFPDGSILDRDNHANREIGECYLDNVCRYATEDEQAIREVIKRFPRAVFDCEHPDNKLAMNGK